jgi:hypothetical protein
MPHIRRLAPLLLVLFSGTLTLAAQQSSSAFTGASPSKQLPSKLKEQAPAAYASTSQPRHRIRFRLAPAAFGAGFSYFSGPAILPLYYPYGYPFWDYYGFSPFWGPAAYGYAPFAFGLSPGYGKGEVKLQVEPKTAEVLIDNAYAGSVESLKGQMWLEPGAYNLCFKAVGYADFCRRIYVLSGKKIGIPAMLAQKQNPSKSPTNQKEEP